MPSMHEIMLAVWDFVKKVISAFSGKIKNRIPKALAIIICCMILLAGCDDGGGLFGGSSTNVEYTVDCASGVTCKNASDTSEFSSSSGDYHSVNCYWYCGDYKDISDKYVTLTFSKRGGGCWEFEREAISRGICI